jgi:hypothetical protein
VGRDLINLGHGGRIGRSGRGQGKATAIVGLWFHGLTTSPQKTVKKNRWKLGGKPGGKPGENTEENPEKMSSETRDSFWDHQ